MCACDRTHKRTQIFCIENGQLWGEYYVLFILCLFSSLHSNTIQLSQNQDGNRPLAYCIDRDGPIEVSNLRSLRIINSLHVIRVRGLCFERVFVTSYRKRYLKTLATCYWFCINSIQAFSSSLFKLGCSGMLSPCLEWLELVYVFDSDTSAGRLKVPFAFVTHHIY